MFAGGKSAHEHHGSHGLDAVDDCHPRGGHAGDDCGWRERLACAKGNARALAAAMREALAAPEMARRAGQIARRALARNYPFGPMIAEHQGLYDAAVQMFGGRRRAEAEATF